MLTEKRVLDFSFPGTTPRLLRQISRDLRQADHFTVRHIQKESYILPPAAIRGLSPAS